VADIEVILQPDGSIEVVNDFQPVLETEFVHWHFRNHNEEVAKVTVEFEEANYFLVDGMPSRSFSRNLSHADTIYGRSPLGRSFPEVGTGKVSGVRDKYSIKAFDDEDLELGCIDPEIVPIRP
jgi:hypothetical protein